MGRTKDTPKLIVEEDDNPTVVELAEEYCKLIEKRNALLEDPIFAQVTEMETKLKAELVKDFGRDSILELRTPTYTVEVGPCAKAARKIKNMARVFKLLGEKNFLAICKINIGDLERNVAPKILKNLLTQDNGYLEKRDIKFHLRSEDE